MIEIEVLIERYRNAGEDARLELFLMHPGLRSAFEEIEQVQLAGTREAILTVPVARDRDTTRPRGQSVAAFATRWHR